MQNMELIEAKDVLPRMLTDFHNEPTIKMWLYTVEPKFFEQYFLSHREGMHTHVILDHRQRDRLKPYLLNNPGLQLRSWQRNRTQHDKTIICALHHVVWITTSNLHRGSFLLANNRSIRVTSEIVYQRCMSQFDAQWRISQIVE
jgi:hypothetical protein